MGLRILTYKEIDRSQWEKLVLESRTGTWFQSPEAYRLFASMPELFRPFAIAVERVNELTNERTLRGVCVGYVTKEKGWLKQYFTRRAIIQGGPVLAEDCSDAEVIALLEAVKTKTRHLQSLDSDLPETTPQSACMQASRQSDDLPRVAGEQQDASQKHASLTKNTKNKFFNLNPIYIETRNFEDYSKWREAFEDAGFRYERHLNFHIDCSDKERMWERMSEVRRRQVKKASATVSLNDAAMLPNEPQASLLNDENDVRAWYAILEKLYRTRVKTPLFPETFFLEAYRQGIAKYLLVKHEGKVIGGMMIVSSSSCVYEWYICGMDAEYKEQYPSVMATWAAMEYANEHGLARFDVMGAGKPGVPYGVRDFKAEFGGKLVEHGRFLCITQPILYRIGVLAVKLLKG